MSDICPVCGESNGRLAYHWSSNRCNYPEMSENQKEVVTGVLMSDGNINRREGRKPRFRVTSTNKKYLQHLDNIFGAFSTGPPTCYRTAEEASSREKIDRFKNSTYQDQYTWTSRSIPIFERWSSWYKTGSKVWPEDINLTSTVLKHFYVGDGSLHKENRTITIYLSNEINNKDKVNSYFTQKGLPKPIWETPTRSDGSISGRIRWNKDNSEKILEYMGEPIQGHEYKW